MILERLAEHVLVFVSNLKSEPYLSKDSRSPMRTSGNDPRARGYMFF